MCNLFSLTPNLYCGYLWDDIPGGFSSSDWSVRLGSMTVSAAATSSTGSSIRAGGLGRVSGLVASRRQSNVLFNRDLCRILCSYIPGTSTEYYEDSNASQEEEEDAEFGENYEDNADGDEEDGDEEDGDEEEDAEVEEEEDD